MIPVPPAIIRICLGDLNGYWILTLNSMCLKDTTGVEDGFNSDRKEDILPSGYFFKVVHFREGIEKGRV